MKKVLSSIIIVVLLVAGYWAVRPVQAATGDVQITLTLPVAHAQTVLEAFNWAADARIELMIDKHDVPASHARWRFTYAAKDPNETNVQFGKRCLTSMVVAVVRAKALADDEERYRDEIAAVEPPAQTIPDDIVQ